MAKRALNPDDDFLYSRKLQLERNPNTMVPNPLQLGRAIGLCVEVKTVELQQHCAERSKYHAERADQKEAELPNLKAAFEAIKGSSSAAAATVAISTMNKGGYQLDPESAIEQLENDIRNHRNKALTFKYLGEHLLDVPYILDKSDLQQLEILK